MTTNQTLTLSSRAAQHYVMQTVANGHEVTEAHLFSHLSEQGGMTRASIDGLIDTMLDQGLIASTIIDAQAIGHGFVPALRAA
jgi:hypothetical protein